MEEADKGWLMTTGEPVPEETFTHSHLAYSSIIPYLLLPSITINGILFIQFTCLTVFLHNLCPSFLWSTSWSGTLQFILVFIWGVCDIGWRSILGACRYGGYRWCCFTAAEISGVYDWVQGRGPAERNRLLSTALRLSAGSIDTVW